MDLGGTVVRYIAQRINHDIFKNPVELMDNISRVTGHIGAKLEVAGCKDATRRVLTVINTNGANLYIRMNQQTTGVYMCL